MPWYPSRYDDLILAEPTLGRYYPLDESGSNTTRVHDRKAGFDLGISGTTPSQILRNQQPIVLSDGRPATKFVSATYAGGLEGSTGAATSGLATGTAKWGLEAWVASPDAANYDIIVGFGSQSAGASAFISFDFGAAEVSSWNGTAVTGTAVNNGKPHYIAGWFDGSKIWLIQDEKVIGSAAITQNITATSFAINGLETAANSYADAFPSAYIAKVAYYTSFDVSMGMRHYLAGLRGNVLETITPERQSWPLWAVTTGGGTVNISVSDSGSGSESFTIAASLTVTDTGSDVESAAIGLSATDSGAGAEAASIGLAFSETGSGTDSGSIGLGASDAGTATESFSESVALTVADTGLGAEALSESVTLTVTDTGIGTDVVNVGVPVAVADTGHGTEAFSISASVPVADTGHGTEAFSESVTLTVTDLATGAETFALSASLAILETGTGIDTPLAIQSVSVADSAVIQESFSVGVALNVRIPIPVGATALVGGASGATTLTKAFPSGATKLNTIPEGAES